MNFPERDDLPSAPGLENLGPFGSVAEVAGKVVRIAQSERRYDPGETTTLESVELFRQAARFVARGFVFVSPHTHLGARNEIIAWIDGAVGPPRVTTPLGHYEELRQYDGVELALLDAENILTCGDEARIEALLSALPVDPPPFGPARFTYDAVASDGTCGKHLGTLRSLGEYPETFTLYASAGDCVSRGMLLEAFPMRRRVGRGGHIGTVPRHVGRFERSSRYGEWQSGLRDPARLQAELAKHQVTDALARAVMHADEVVGGFRGDRGIDFLAPWAVQPLLTRASVFLDPGVTYLHPYESGLWILGRAHVSQYPALIYLGGDGAVWAMCQRPEDDWYEKRLVGTSIEGWFERQLFLLEYGYASERMCRPAEHLPKGLEFCEALSDTAAQVYLDRNAEAVWLVDEGGIQRMSRKVATLEEVLEVAARDE